MSFEDRYAITDSKLSEKERLSLSIDEAHSKDSESKVIASLLYVEDKSKREHYHIDFSLKELRQLRCMLILKGVFYVNLEHYRLEHKNFEITLFEVGRDENKYPISLDELVSFKISLEAIHKMVYWIDEVLSYTEEELLEKYNKDLKRK